MPWSTSELRVELAPWNWFKPCSKIFLLTVPRRYFFRGSFVLGMSCVCHAFASGRSLLHCGHQLGKDLPLDPCLWCLVVLLSLSHVVFWVSCGTCLYRCLIFTPLLTFPIWNPSIMYNYDSTCKLANVVRTKQIFPDPMTKPDYMYMYRSTPSVLRQRKKEQRLPS